MWIKCRKAGAVRGKVLKAYREAMDNKKSVDHYRGSLKKWAKKVFPIERTSTAVEKLWEAILMTVRVSEDNDPKEAWDRHNEELKAKCEKLNSCQLEYLHYESSNGTDFKCWLIRKRSGMGEEIPCRTALYNPNMPTEEVFTSPMKGKCEGTLVSTMPLSYQGNLIDKFSVTFENGKVVSLSG